MSLHELPSDGPENLREACGFCQIPQTGTTKYFQCLHGDLSHVVHIPDVPDTWTVLQDVVPLAEHGGHLLIMPNTHRISLATVDDQDALTATTKQVTSALQKFFSHPIFAFEHGPGFIEGEQIACGGCHLDHAHGHMLLLPEDSTLASIKRHVEEILSASGWDNVSTRAINSDSLFTDTRRIAEMQPYLHIGMVNPNKIYAFTYVQRSLSERVESQLLRRVISEEVYKRPDPIDWHWRDITSGIASPEKLNQLKADVVLFRSITGL